MWTRGGEPLSSAIKTFDNYVTPPEIRLGVKPWVLEAPQRKA
jgi:hypothetical protein